MNDIISKVYAADPQAAAVLIDEVAAAMMHEEAMAALPALRPVLLANASRNVRKAKAALAKGYIAKAASGQYPDASAEIGRAHV
jgi:hypothetical protein